MFLTRKPALGFEPRTLGLWSQGPTIELQCVYSKDDDILYINPIKVQQKVEEPPEISLIQPSIQLMWANLSIYSLGFLYQGIWIFQFSEISWITEN